MEWMNFSSFCILLFRVVAAAEVDKDDMRFRIIVHMIYRPIHDRTHMMIIE